MAVNSLPKTVTRQRRGCDLNPGPSVPEPSTLTTRLPSHPNQIGLICYNLRRSIRLCRHKKVTFEGYDRSVTQPRGREACLTFLIALTLKILSVESSLNATRLTFKDVY